MAPLKTSLSRSVGKLLGVQQDTDLSLRGATQSTRVPPPDAIPFRFAMFGGGGSGAGWVGGGGGGGGYVEEEITTLVTGVTYTVNIGAAGATPGPAPPGSDGDGNAGGNTTFVTPGGTFTAYGGGGGGGNNLAGQPGGSGGGSGGTSVATVGSGNKVTGTSNPAQASPPQPQTLSRVQGYDGGTYGPQPGGESTGGGGGAGGAGTDGSSDGAGNGGAGITVSNYGPYNGTFGAGGGGSQTGSPPPDHANGGSPFAGHGTNSSNSEKNASGYANGGGGVREAGYAGGSATAGIFLMRTPDAVTITLSSGTQTSGSGYKYVRMTANGTISFS